MLLKWQFPVKLCSPKTSVPSLLDLMPGDLRWSWCNSKRNKVHNKCHALESSPKPFPLPESLEKLSSMKPFPGAKNIGNCCPKRYTEAPPCQRLGLSYSVTVTLFGNRVFFFYHLKNFTASLYNYMFYNFRNILLIQQEKSQFSNICFVHSYPFSATSSKNNEVFP